MTAAMWKEERKKKKEKQSGLLQDGQDKSSCFVLEIITQHHLPWPRNGRRGCLA